MKNYITGTLVCLLILVLAVGVTQAVEFDFDGEKVTYLLAWQEGEFEEGEGLAHFNSVQEDFNVEIEFKVMAAKQIKQQFPASILAGDPMGDVIWLAHAPKIEMVAQGILAPLNEALERIDYWERVPECQRDIQKELATYAGTTYGFSYNDTGQPRMLIWNKTLFNEEGLPNLYDLQDNDEWTWDKFKEIVVQARKDTDGDGTIDQWGYAFNKRSINISTNAWVYANGGAIYEENENGRTVFQLDQPAAIEALNFMHELYSQDLVYKGDDPLGNLWNGNLAMMDGQYEWDYVLRRPEELSDEFGMVFLPKGPKADDYVAWGRGDFYGFNVALNTDHDAAALVELTSALYELTAPYIDIEEYYDNLVESFAESAFDYETVENFEKMLSKRAIVRYAHMGPIAKIYRESIQGEQSPAAVVETYKQEVQTNIDEIWGKIEN